MSEENTEPEQQSDDGDTTVEKVEEKADQTAEEVRGLRADMEAGFARLGDAVAALGRQPKEEEKKEPEKDEGSREPEKREGPSGAKPAESDTPRRRKVAWRQ